MLAILRMVGVINGAVWLGAAVSFACATNPAFFSKAMLQVLPVSHAGAALLIVARHYFLMQYCCAAVAVAHLAAEWLYAGKPVRRWFAALVIGLFAMALLGGEWLNPRLQRLHLDLYGVRSTPQQREKARAQFQGWQIAAQAVSVVSIFGLTTYVWLVTSTGGVPRFGSAARFRGLTNNVS